MQKKTRTTIDVVTEKQNETTSTRNATYLEYMMEELNEDKVDIAILQEPGLRKDDPFLSVAERMVQNRHKVMIAELSRDSVAGGIIIIMTKEWHKRLDGQP